MTSLISSVDELHFSKEYVSSFGTSVYLQQKIKVSGSVAFDFHDEYKTLTLKLDEKSVKVIDNLNKNLELLGMPSIKMTIHETFGTSMYIKVKKNQVYTKAERGQIIENLELTLSIFTNKRNETFASLSI